MAKKRPGVAQWIAEAAVPLLVLDRRRRVRVFNRGVQQLTGREAGDVLGQLARFTPAEQPQAAGSVEALLSAIAPAPNEYHGQITGCPVTLPTPRGPITRQAVYVPLEDPAGGEPHLMILLLADVPAATAAVSSHHQALAAVRTLGHPLIATAPAMQRPLRQFEVACEMDVSVHLSGPLGSGRRTFAREIHRQFDRGLPLLELTIERPRRPQQMQTLLDSVTTDQPPTALLLADVDKLPLDVQADLATALVRHDEPPRLLTTSLHALPELVADETLHPDFASLLGTIPIVLPPLTDRLDDLPLLAQALIEAALDGREQPAGLAEETLAELLAHTWPGNVGELARCLTAAVERSTGPLLQPGDMPFSLATSRDAIARGDGRVLEPIKDLLEATERRHIEAALVQSGGSKAGAAKLLGMTRPKLYRRIEALGIEAAK